MGPNILIQYIKWHFLEMPKKITQAWKNVLRFNLNFFSVGLLLKTLFSPWRRYSWSYGRGFDLKRYISVFFSNLISRSLGAAVRGILISLGILIEIFIILGGIITILGWLILPPLLILGFFYGFKILL